MTDQVTAVVVTYNRKELLRECLDSLYSQTHRPDGIILIDNASTDGTGDLVRSEYSDGLVDYVLMDSNTGGAGGFCEGLRIARERDCGWIWLMDDDTIPKEDALEKLLAAVKDIGEDVSFVSSCVYGPGGEFMNVPNISQTRGANGYRDWYSQLKHGAVKIADATFVSTLINRDAVLDCGLPCADYFIWGDDTEYTMRLIKHYGPAYLIGPSEVIHKRFNARRLVLNEETDPGRIGMYRYFYRNLLINKSLYNGKRACLSFLYGAVKTSFRSLGTPYGWKKFRTVYSGILSFIRQRKAVASYIAGQLGD